MAISRARLLKDLLPTLNDMFGLELKLNYPTSRDEARRARVKYYFTGKVCRQGHTALRLTHNMSCVECNEIYQRAVCDRRRAQSASKKSPGVTPMGRLDANWKPTIIEEK